MYSSLDPTVCLEAFRKAGYYNGCVYHRWRLIFLFLRILVIINVGSVGSWFRFYLSHRGQNGFLWEVIAC